MESIELEPETTGATKDIGVKEEGVGTEPEKEEPGGSEEPTVTRI